MIHCSRLHVFKQAYGICEALSVTAGFELVEGRHKPKVCSNDDCFIRSYSMQNARSMKCTVLQIYTYFCTPS